LEPEIFRVSKSLQHLALQNKSLQQMILNRTFLGDEGVRRLAFGLESNTHLKLLSLTQCKIGGMGAKHLASMISKNKSLVELRLGGNWIDDYGFESIVEALTFDENAENSPLKTLGMESNRITYAHLETLFNTSRLENLYLCDNPLVQNENESIHLAQVLAYSTLKKISLKNTGAFPHHFAHLSFIMECIFPIKI